MVKCDLCGDVITMYVIATPYGKFCSYKHADEFGAKLRTLYVAGEDGLDKAVRLA